MKTVIADLSDAEVETLERERFPVEGRRRQPERFLDVDRKWWHKTILAMENAGFNVTRAQTK